MKISFRAMQAILYVCPVCNERFVGGEVSADEESAKWVNMHGDWHGKDNVLPPPANTRALYGFIGVGI
jgi:hypothetical protein